MRQNLSDGILNAAVVVQADDPRGLAPLLEQLLSRQIIPIQTILRPDSFDITGFPEQDKEFRSARQHGEIKPAPEGIFSEAPPGGDSQVNEDIDNPTVTDDHSPCQKQRKIDQDDGRGQCVNEAENSGKP